MKFCKDCKHHTKLFIASGVCGKTIRQKGVFHERNKQPVSWSFFRCQEAREEDGPCGPDAKNFEPIEETKSD